MTEYPITHPHYRTAILTGRLAGIEATDLNRLDFVNHGVHATSLPLTRLASAFPITTPTLYLVTLHLRLLS